MLRRPDKEGQEFGSQSMRIRRWPNPKTSVSILALLALAIKAVLNSAYLSNRDKDGDDGTAKEQ